MMFQRDVDWKWYQHVKLQYHILQPIGFPCFLYIWWSQYIIHRSWYTSHIPCKKNLWKSHHYRWLPTHWVCQSQICEWNGSIQTCCEYKSVPSTFYNYNGVARLSKGPDSILWDSYSWMDIDIDINHYHLYTIVVMCHFYGMSLDIIWCWNDIDIDIDR